MLMFIILAEICLTIGTPNWTVLLCGFGFGVSALKVIKQFLKNLKKNQPIEK